MSHRECEMNYIQESSAQFSESEEYLNLETCLDELKARISEAMNKIKENTLQVENAYRSAMSAVKEMKKKIIDCLKKFEHELEVDAMAYKKTNENKMIELNSGLDDLQTDTLETDILISKLKREKKYNSLFVEGKRAAKRILDYHERIYEISTRNCIKEMIYIPTTELDNILTRENMFGTLVELDNELGPYSATEYLESSELCQINIKSEIDKKTCYATGLAFLSTEQLAVADKANKNVKIVDVSYDKIISEITLSSCPRDVTVIPPDQLVVTLREEEKIQLLSTANGLKKTEQITTVGNCRGIKYDDGKLIVVYDGKRRAKIEILSLKGEVLYKFQSNESGTALVNEPKCIGLSPDHNQMYVTDFSKMCIFRLSKLGNVQGTFGRHMFMGVAVSTGGSVYACSKSGSTVYQLSDDLSKVQKVLTTADGIKEPTALAVSNARNMLYVSCGNTDANVSNKLHVFKIKLETDALSLRSERL
ncbi:uncharacterized protein LOC123542005 [Mercenaria mercenaria]|uniref:uncharacterized protein LOC123542005 n=1 Tax=Mercenaria mercenaria TaxID=6596 RepID=UPI001E1DBE90|nr:uncharacterized protein LOC123542005 [Mercenaria mercenaria]